MSAPQRPFVEPDHRRYEQMKNELVADWVAKAYVPYAGEYETRIRAIARECHV